MGTGLNNYMYHGVSAHSYRPFQMLTGAKFSHDKSKIKVILWSIEVMIEQEVNKAGEDKNK